MLSAFFSKWSYLGIIAFLAVSGCGIPIPEEVALVLAGVLSSNGVLEEPWLAFGACLIGAVLGDTIMYGIGRFFGHSWLTKHPRFAKLVHADQESQFEQAVQDHGFKVLFLSRFLVGVRGPVYYAAGAARVPYLKFLLWDLIAATIVVSIVFWLAYFFGERVLRFIREAEYYITAIVLTVVGVVGYILYRKSQKTTTRKMEKLIGDIDGDGLPAPPPAEERPKEPKISA